MSISVGYHEYIGSVLNIRGISLVHRGMLNTLEVTMSTSGGYHEYTKDVQYIGEYHYACGGYHE